MLLNIGNKNLRVFDKIFKERHHTRYFSDE